MAMVALDDLLACLVVERDGAGPEGPTSSWTARNLTMDYRRVFGGQLVAQAIAAATADANATRLARGGDPDLVVKSLHCLFPREGDADRPLMLEVEALHDGRTFAARRVSAAHDGKAFFAATISLHVPEPGLDHQDIPPAVAAPDEATGADLSMIPWECRVIGGADLADPAAGPSSYQFWSRVDVAVLDDAFADHAEPGGQWVHQALLGHATDLTVIGTALRPHDGFSQADSQGRLITAVTSHSLWFHRPVRLDDWTLISQASPSASAGRGFGWGHAFAAAGDLVASFAQESMIRVVDDDE